MQKDINQNDPNQMTFDELLTSTNNVTKQVNTINTQQQQIIFEVRIDTVCYKSKPTRIGDIRERFKNNSRGTEPKQYTIDDLKREVAENGRTFTPAIVLGEQKSTNWQQQQIFAIDIDNEDKTAQKGIKRPAERPLSGEQAIARAKEYGLNPALLYHTFSNSQDWEKFRIIFVCDTVIKDIEERNLIQNILMQIFPECDTACKDPARLFFGANDTDSNIYVDNTTFSKATIFDIAKKFEHKSDVTKNTTATTDNICKDTQYKNNVNVHEKALDFDLLDYVKSNYTFEKEVTSGNVVTLSPCPICGHADDFVIYTDTNTFNCFGANAPKVGSSGGTVIDFLKWTKFNGDDSKATQYFLYDILKLEKIQKSPQQQTTAEIFDITTLEKKIKNTQQKEDILNKTLIEDCVKNDFTELLLKRSKDLKCKTEIEKAIKDAKKKIEHEQAKQRIAEYKNTKLEQVKNTDTIPEFIRKVFSDDSPFNNYIFVDDNENVKIFPHLLATYIQNHVDYKLVRSEMSTDCEFFLYENGVYKSISNQELKGYIKCFIAPFAPKKVRNRDLIEVLELLKADIHSVRNEDFNTNEKLINFKNGLLNIDTMEFFEHTPKELITVQLPFDYNPQATECSIFDNYINTLCENRPDYIKLILQVIGVVISNVHAEKAKKMLFIVGNHDSGKSKLIDLLCAMLGSSLTQSIDLEQLESKNNRFGTYDIYNKRLVFEPDLRYMLLDQINILKKLTGGDNIRVEIKNSIAFNYKYHGFLMFCANELPRFGGDIDPEVYDRFMIFDVNHRIHKSEQDKNLIEKMIAEIPAIVNKVLPYLQEFLQNGYNFTEPKTFTNNRNIYMIENNPVRQFIQECCVERDDIPIRENDPSTQTNMRDAFVTWLKDNYAGRKCYTKKDLTAEIMRIYGAKSVDEVTTRTHNGTRYFNLKLTDNALKELLHKDTSYINNCLRGYKAI